MMALAPHAGTFSALRGQDIWMLVMVNRGVFINYRGEDNHSYGALLYTELVRQFGADHVFLDVESIPAGVVIQELPARCGRHGYCWR